jgi:hypothetical protein
MSRAPSKKSALSKAVIYAVMKTVMPKYLAKTAAGYSAKTRGNPDKQCVSYEMDVTAIRARLAEIPGFASAWDVIKDLVEIKTGSMEEKDYEVALAAIKQLSKIMGYEAPLKMEVQGSMKIEGAARLIHEVVAQGITPGAVRAEIERRKAAKEIEFREVLPAPHKAQKTPQVVGVPV